MIKNKDKKDKIVSRWLTEIEAYENEYSAWVSRCKDINKIYKSQYYDNLSGNNRPKNIPNEVNIFWANIQTMIPEIYAKLPTPQIERRFKDSDAVARVASEVLENCCNFILDCSNANEAFDMCNLDGLLYARATLWARYDADFKGTGYKEKNEDGEDEEVEELDNEYVELDYVNYCDFGHNVASTWEEVHAVWRKLYLSRGDIIQRFGKEVAKDIKMDAYSSAKNGSVLKKQDDKCDRVCVYEVWDKYKKRVIWLTKTHDKPLDIKDDYLNLKDFFPCPRPLYVTKTNDCLIPVPDYVIYQDQLTTLNRLNQRINMITEAVKVVGFYNSEIPALANALRSSTDNTMIAVNAWGIYAEKGGAKGNVEWLPIQEIAGVLENLYQAFERQKQIIYELTGISDLLRGQTDPSETATGLTEKRESAKQRFVSRRNKFSQFLRNAINIIVEIVAEKFDTDTLKKMSNVKLFDTEKEKQQAEQQMQQGLQIDEDMQDMLLNPTWEEVAKFLKNDDLVNFRIDIETDSTIRADEQQEKASRLEMLTSVGGFLQQAMPAIQQSPQLAPVLGEMLLYGLRAFRAGKGIEAEMVALVDNARKMALQPQEPPPNPEMMKVEAEQQAKQAQLQLEQQRLQFEAQTQQQQFQLEMAKLELEKAKLAQIPQVKQMELEHNVYMDNLQSQRETQDKALQAQLDQQTTLNEQQQQSLDTLRTAQIELEKDIQLKQLDIQMDRENQDLELYKIDKQEDTKKQLALLSANTSIEQAKQSNKNKGKNNAMR